MSNFFDNMLPYAQKASTELGIPVSVILGQWGNESGQGTSLKAKNDFNFAGIMNPGGVSSGSKKYKSITEFTTDYIRVMKLSYYDKVRSAGSVSDTVKALGASPYDAGHYGGQGQNVMSVITGNNLTKYDGITIATIPATTVKKQQPQSKQQIKAKV